MVIKMSLKYVDKGPCDQTPMCQRIFSTLFDSALCADKATRFISTVSGATWPCG